MTVYGEVNVRVERGHVILTHHEAGVDYELELTPELAKNLARALVEEATEATRLI